MAGCKPQAIGYRKQGAGEQIRKFADSLIRNSQLYFHRETVRCGSFLLEV